MAEELIKREIVKERIHKDSYRYTEETEGEIIDWYKRSYGVQVDIWETFDLYYECIFCGKIFKNQEDKRRARQGW